MIAETIAEEVRKVIDEHLSEWLSSEVNRKIEVIVDDNGGHRCEEFGSEKNIRIMFDSSRFERCKDMEMAALSICGYEILRYGFHKQELNFENLVIHNAVHELCHAIQFILNDEIFIDEDEYEGYHNAYFYKLMKRFYKKKIGADFILSCRESVKNLGLDNSWTYPKERINKVLKVMPGDSMMIIRSGEMSNCEVTSVGASKVFVRINEDVFCVGMFGLS